jgi:hypothetical protein
MISSTAKAQPAQGSAGNRVTFKKAITPAIALSGFGMEEEVAPSELSGFDAYCGAT